MPDTLQEAWLAFGVALLAIVAAAAALWPARPRLATAAWFLAPAAFLAAFRGAPGAVPAVVGLLVAFMALRAVDAARLVGADALRTRAAYVSYVMDLTVPAPGDERAPPPRDVIRARLVRGLVLVSVGILLVLVGWRAQLWRVAPYADDLLVVLEVAVGVPGLIDLLSAGLWARGRRAPDIHSGSFVRARSLRAFWTQWNRAVSGTLARAVFDPITRRGRRRLGLGVMATFAASGAFHAVPLLVASSDRRASVTLAASALAFFLSHGALVALEGTRLRRWLGPAGGRAFTWLAFAATAPLYPIAHGVAIGLHGRPVEALTWWPLVLRLGF